MPTTIPAKSIARELAPGASGYTVDTLSELRLELGADTELWLLLGADQYAKLGSWHRPEDVEAPRQDRGFCAGPGRRPTGRESRFRWNP